MNSENRRQRREELLRERELREIGGFKPFRVVSSNDIPLRVDSRNKQHSGETKVRIPISQTVFLYDVSVPQDEPTDESLQVLHEQTMKYFDINTSQIDTLLKSLRTEGE